jgi:hypothetical protein
MQRSKCNVQNARLEIFHFELFNLHSPPYHRSRNRSNATDSRSELCRYTKAKLAKTTGASRAITAYPRPWLQRLGIGRWKKRSGDGVEV